MKKPARVPKVKEKAKAKPKPKPESEFAKITRHLQEAKYHGYRNAKGEWINTY